MSLLDVFEAAQPIAVAVTGITTVYQLPPELPPDDDLLPAVIFAPRTGPIEWGMSLEVWTHEFDMWLLVKRGGDVQSEYAAIMPLVEDLVAAFRTETTLGIEGVYAFQPAEYEITNPELMQTTYVGARIGWTVKEKIPITLG